MKKLFILLSFIPLVSFSQNLIEEVFPTQNGKIIYQEVVSVDSTVSAQEIYTKTRNWMVDVFNSSKDVIQVEDKENFTIIGKGYIEKGHNPYAANPKNWFTFRIEAKDGRYRYTLYDIIYEFDVTMLDVHQHTEKPLEEWGDTSKMDIKNPSKKEKTFNALRDYYKSLDAEFILLIESLNNSIQAKVQDW